jgi:hypothetical protein
MHDIPDYLSDGIIDASKVARVEQTFRQLVIRNREINTLEELWTLAEEMEEFIARKYDTAEIRKIQAEHEKEV